MQCLGLVLVGAGVDGGKCSWDVESKSTES